MSKGYETLEKSAMLLAGVLTVTVAGGIGAIVKFVKKKEKDYEEIDDTKQKK